MTKYDQFIKLNNEVASLREDCENFCLRVAGTSSLHQEVNKYLEANKQDILKTCALNLLRRRDKALIDTKSELEQLLKHIEDINDDKNGTDKA